MRVFGDLSCTYYSSRVRWSMICCDAPVQFFTVEVITFRYEQQQPAKEGLQRFCFSEKGNYLLLVLVLDFWV